MKNMVATVNREWRRVAARRKAAEAAVWRQSPDLGRWHRAGRLAIDCGADVAAQYLAVAGQGLDAARRRA